MKPNDVRNSDGEQFSSVQCSLPNESSEWRQETNFLPAGDAPGSLGKFLTTPLVRDPVATSGSPRSSRAAWFCFGLVLLLTLAVAAVRQSSASITRKVRNPTLVGWYFKSGQWLADIRTFAAAYQFVMDQDQAMPGQNRAPATQLAMPESDMAPGTTSVVEAGPSPRQDS